MAKKKRADDDNPDTEEFRSDRFTIGEDEAPRVESIDPDYVNPWADDFVDPEDGLFYPAAEGETPDVD